jgi:SprT protein
MLDFLFRRRPRRPKPAARTRRAARVECLTAEQQALQDRATAAVAYWIARANRVATRDYGIAIPVPEVRFDLQGATAGYALFPERGAPYLRLNRDLLERHPGEMIDQTVPHEVAHIVARRLHGWRAPAHGEEWRRVMDYFGKPAERTHSMAGQPVRKVRRFTYTCECPDFVHRITAVRHFRAERGARYACRQCGSRLRKQD